MPTQPRSTAVATTSSQVSPAPTSTNAPPQGRPRRARPGVAYDDHAAGVPLVGDDQVAAAADDQHRGAALVGEPHGLDQRGLVVGLDQLRGRAAEAQRRQLGEGRDGRSGTARR